MEQKVTLRGVPVEPAENQEPETLDIPFKISVLNSLQSNWYVSLRLKSAFWNVYLVGVLALT